ncbi:MAG: Hsp33 family molecular chaperone HslO [Legionellaceae bacterium]|nr:Hsp33 family molecular chaperone HslO [Legionellaceae bacterium]
MQRQDSLQRFLFEHASIRGEIIHLDNTYKTIIEQRPYPLPVRKLLGEAILSCVLFAGSIKFEGEIGLQFHGDERLPLLIVQCNHNLEVRAVAKFHPDLTVDYNSAFLDGKMVFNINQKNQTQTYQSIVPIKSTSMADNLMQYFSQSEQLSTQVFLAIDNEHAAGILLQLMPGQNTEQRENFWEYAVQIGQTITEHELLTLENTEVLHRLYHETELRIFDSRPVKFACTCDIGKMKSVLATIGEKGVQELLKENGCVEIFCDFCNQRYAFDEIDVTLLFKD